MTIEQLQQDMYAAMKANEPIRKSVLSSAIGAVKNAAIAKNCRDNITKELVAEVLLKEKKTLQEQIDTCPADRMDLLNEYKLRMAVMEEYAPKLIDDPEAIKKDVRNILYTLGIEETKKNRGAVMKAVMPHFKGKADMAVVNKVIGEMLV